MKRLLLLFIATIVVISCFAQDQWKLDPNDYKNRGETKNLSAGDYLRQSGNCHLIGTGLVITGTVIAFKDIRDNDFTLKNEDNTRVIVGGVCIVGGFILNVVGYSKLIQAGKKMNEQKKVSFYPSSSGIGIAMRF